MGCNMRIDMTVIYSHAVTKAETSPSWTVGVLYSSVLLRIVTITSTLSSFLLSLLSLFHPSLCLPLLFFFLSLSLSLPLN